VYKLTRRIAKNDDLKWFNLENYKIDDLSINHIISLIVVRKNIISLIEEKKSIIPSLNKISDFFNEEKTIKERIPFIIFSEHEKSSMFMLNEIFNKNNPLLKSNLENFDDFKSLNGSVSKTDISLSRTKSIIPVSVNTLFHLYNETLKQSECDLHSFKNNRLEKDTGREWSREPDLYADNWGKYWYSQRLHDSVNSIIPNDSNAFISVDLTSSDEEIIKQLTLLLPALRNNLTVKQKDTIKNKFGIVNLFNIKTFSLIAVLDFIIFAMLHDDLIVSDSVISKTIYSDTNIRSGLLVNALDLSFIDRTSDHIQKYERKESLRLVSDDFLLKANYLIENDKMFSGEDTLKNVILLYKKKMGI